MLLDVGKPEANTPMGEIAVGKSRGYWKTRFFG
jgi:hypothetical protein